MGLDEGGGLGNRFGLFNGLVHSSFPWVMGKPKIVTR